MPGIFPDNGVAATQATNAENATVAPTNCTNQLFYGKASCRPSFDPNSMNAIVSELLNFMDRANHSYDCNRLDNLAQAMGKQPIPNGNLV